MDRINNFADYLRTNDKSDNTISSYQSDLRQFKTFLGKDVDGLQQEDIDRFKESLKEQGLKMKTINRKLVSVKQYIDYLNTEHSLGVFIKIKQEKQQRQDYLEDMLDKQDFKKLVTAAVTNNNTRAKAIFYTLFYTGARVSEALQIKKNEFNQEYIWVKGKGNKYRQLFITSKVRTAWVEYLKTRKDNSDYLFTGQRGAISRQTVHTEIKKYAAIAGIPEEKAHAHNFRHLFCVNMYEQTGDISVVADLAGHSDINTTRIYTRKTKNELMAAINEL